MTTTKTERLLTRNYTKLTPAEDRTLVKFNSLKIHKHIRDTCQQKEKQLAKSFIIK